MNITLSISPVDSWFFRDGRQYEEVGGLPVSSELIPSQRTVYGALRARVFELFKDEPETRKLLIGNEYDSLAESPTFTLPLLRLSAIYLLSPDHEVYVPKPNDLLSKKISRHSGTPPSSEDIELYPANKFLSAVTDLNATIPTQLVELPAQAVAHQYAMPYLNINRLNNWLNNETKKYQPNNKHKPIVELPTLISKETRIGIERHGKQAADGQLYHTEHIRLKDWQFIVQLTGHPLSQEDQALLDKCEQALIKQLKKSSVQRLGADGKGAYFERLNEPEIDRQLNIHPIETSNKTTKYAITLLSPALLHGPYGFLTSEDFQHVDADKAVLAFEQFSAMIDHPQYDKGRSMANGKSSIRPVRQLTPAGTTFFVTFCNAKPKVISEKLRAWKTPQIGELNQYGFGHIAIRPINT